MTSYISLDYGDGGHQSFGGYALYLPESWDHHKLETVAGHFIFRVMEVAGVTEWNDLVGRTIRVESNHSGVYRIGHIVKDDWFDPKADFNTDKND